MNSPDTLHEDKVTKWFLIFGYVISFFVISMISFSRDSFYGEMIENFSERKTSVILGCFTLLFFTYYKYFVHLEIIKSSRIFIFLIGVVTLCFVIPPFFSSDISAYLLAAKNAFYYHLNPYITSYTGVLSNPWLNEIDASWLHDYPSSYGPLFTLISGIPILFAKSFFVSVYIYKFVALVAFAATFFLLYTRLPIEKEKRKLLALMFALNPAILLHLVIESHNDIFVILFFVIAYLLYINQKQVLSLSSLISSALIKYSTFAMLPIYWFRDKQFNTKQTLISIVVAAVVSVLFIVLFRVYESPLYFSQINIVSNRCLYSYNPYHQILYSLPQQFARYINYFIVFCLYGYTTYKYLFKSFSYLKFSFWATFIVIFVYSSWGAPWYPTLLITIGILINEKKYHYLVYALTFYSLIHIYLPF